MILSLDDFIVNFSFKKEVLLIEKTEFISYPSGRTATLINDMMIYSSSIDKLVSNMKEVSHSIDVDMKSKENSRRLIYTSKSSKSETSITIQIEDITEMTDISRKLFNIALMKMTNGTVSKGQLAKDYVSISLKELVDGGFYKTIESARKGFKRSAKCLVRQISFQGTIVNYKKKVIQEDFEVMFTGYHIKNNIGYLSLNPKVNYEFLFLTYTKVPYFEYMSLSVRTGDLLIYIMTLARQKQNTAKIINNAPFNISVRAVAHKLGLPSYSDTKNPGRDIIGKIESSVNDILSTVSSRCISIEIRGIGCHASSRDTYDNGYLQIALKNEYRDYFSSLYERNSKEE